MTFDGERLIFMPTSGRHENWSRRLYRLGCVITEEADLPQQSTGAFTCRNDDVERGAEPAESFYFYDVAILRGEFPEVGEGPPPDLIIEADYSRSSVGRLPIFAKLGVREAWRYNGAEVLFYVLQDDGSYLLVDQSATFPWLARIDVTELLHRTAELDERRQSRQFRAWVREKLGTAAT